MPFACLSAKYNQKAKPGSAAKEQTINARTRAPESSAQTSVSIAPAPDDKIDENHSHEQWNRRDVL